MTQDVRLYIAGEWVEGRETYQVTDPYREVPIATVHVADEGQVDQVTEAARRGQQEWLATPLFERVSILRRVADTIMDDQEAIARAILSETSKPIGACRDEVLRVAETLQFSADAAGALHGTTVPMDASRRGVGRSVAFTLRVPYGVVLGIVPFNSPMNLAAHKVGPALAAGNAVIIKPHPQTPRSVARLVQAFHEVGVPKGAVSLIHGGPEIGRTLVAHPKVDLVSFTGGVRTARSIVADAGIKKVLTELGGDGPNIVWSDADLDRAASDLAKNAYSYAGQSCIGVQRVYVHASVREAFQEKMLAATAKLRMGDPGEEGVDLGPMIDEASAERVAEWVEEAVAGGARLLAGGGRDGRFMEPTLLTDVTTTMRVVCEEVFGPVASIIPVAHLDEAVAAVNASEFGLQAGVYTESHRVAFEFARRLEVGGVLVNATSNSRVDQQPYGGMKRSGIGREGPRYAAIEMSQERIVVF